jgi:hypothetical protein
VWCGTTGLTTSGLTTSRSPSLQSLASPSDNLLWLAAAPLVAREGQFVLKYFLLRPYGGEFKRRV